MWYGVFYANLTGCPLSNNIACLQYLTGVLCGPLMPWFSLKVTNGGLSEFPERDDHGILNRTKPVLYVATSLHLLQGREEKR